MIKVLQITFYAFFCLWLISSCATIKNNAKYELSDGKYKHNKKKIYVDNEEEVIKIKTETEILQFPYNSDKNIPTFTLTKPSLDLDIFTTILKVRPATEFVPAQLNTNFNGNIYIGFRNDKYKIKYEDSYFGNFHRQITHIGYSYGIFAGLGNTFISPTNTNNVFPGEYDGIVSQKGISGILAVDKISVGLNVGFDNLLDYNKHIWIYEGKLWVGLVFGVSLN